MNRKAPLGSWLTSLAYIPLLYGGGWLLARPLALAWPQLRADQLDLATALIALSLLLLSLPAWVRRRWRVVHPWQELGVWPGAGSGVGQALAAGWGQAVLLLGVITALMLLSEQASWQAKWSPGLAANALALGLGVGFAEELLFRGWLWGELERPLGRSWGALVQAVLFGLVHPWSRHGLAGLPLLLGLVLLGLVLAERRRRDGGTLWGAIALHGGLVGGWFALQQGGLEFHAKAAGWLWGPGLPHPNPIGGLPGLMALVALLLINRR